MSIGVFPSKGAIGSWKASKAPKKKKQAKKPPTMLEDVMKAILPLQSRIFKHTKKQEKKSHDSPVKQSVPEPEIETTEQTHVDYSHTHSSQKGIKKIRKP